MTSSLQTKLEKVHITQSMLDNLDYDTGTENKNTMTPTPTNGSDPLDIFVFSNSDLEAASYYLAKSLENPLNPDAIKCSFVQESCVEKFCGKLKSKLKPYSQEALKNKSLSNALTRSLEIIAKLNAKTIRPDTEKTHAATLVYDVAQENFTAAGPSPVVTLYTFRTVKEAIALSKKESIVKSATIWCENHATAYEVITSTGLNDYYLNCCNVSWACMKDYIAKKQPYALINGSYHYETLNDGGSQKNVVFPIGTSFAN